MNISEKTTRMRRRESPFSIERPAPRVLEVDELAPAECLPGTKGIWIAVDPHIGLIFHFERCGSEGLEHLYQKLWRRAAVAIVFTDNSPARRKGSLADV